MKAIHKILSLPLTRWKLIHQKRENYFFQFKAIIFILFLLYSTTIPILSQVNLAGWDFPNSPDNATCDFGTTPNLTKTITLVNAAVSNTIDFSKAGNGTRSASALNWKNGASVNCFVFNDIETTGYSAISFSAKMGSGNTNSPRDFQIQYRVNNGSWTDVGSPITYTTAWSSVATDLSLPSADNQSDVDIRILQTTEYDVSNTNNSIGTGNAAFAGVDDIVIKGSPLKTFYSSGSNTANTLSNWWTNTNGTGVNPTNFSTNANTFIIQNGHTVTTNANWTINGTNSKLQINSGGTLVASNTVSTTEMIVANNGTYRHNIDGGVIPTATWDVGSTCLITGVTTSLPSNVGQGFGNFTWNNTSQTADLSYATALTTINGNLNIISTGSGILNLMFSGPSNYTTNVGGDFNQSGGVFKLVGNNSSIGNMTLNIGGNFNLTGGTFDLQGDLGSVGSGTVNLAGNFSMSGSSTLTESGIGTANFNFSKSGTRTYSKSSGTISNTVNFNVNSSSILNVGTSVIDGSNGTFNLNSGAGIITAHTQGLSTTAGTGSIRVTGTKTYNNDANYTYNSSATQVTGNGLTTANNLTINNDSPTGVTLSNAVTVSGTLTLTSGKLNTTTVNLLTISNTANSAISSASASSFVKGPLRWNLPAISSSINYIFPTGSTDYLPFTLVNPTTSGTSYVQVQAFNQSTGGTAGSSVNQISTTEYWQLTNGANFTNSSISLSRPTLISPYNSIGGSTTASGVYSLLNGTSGNYDVSSSDLISTNRFFVFAEKKPTITVTPSSLSGFTYPQGFGPSSQSSFTVSGINLVANITVLPTDSFEISLTSGASFAVQTIITLPVINSTVSTTTIYVRMKAGLNLGNINPIIPIRCTSVNAVTRTINCTGVVTNAPTITTTPNTLSGFYYNVNATTTPVQSFTVSGAYLTSDLIITAPTNYEIFTAATGTFLSSLTYSPSSGTVTSKTIYVRLKLGLTGGIYNQNINIASSNITKMVLCEGSVNAPFITVSTFVLGGFIYTFNAGPSGEQTFVVSAANLTTNLILTTPANFEIKKRIGGTYGATASYTPTSGAVSPDTIYVRMKSGLPNGTVIPPTNLTVTSTGAIQQNVALSGKVVNTSTNLTSSATLTGFVYTFGNGPSVVQSFTVSGTSLTNNITVTPPSNYEICLTPSGTYVNSALTITQSAGKVNAKTVYVRLKGGLAIATYGTPATPVNIVIASVGASDINVSINGKVIAVPTVTTGTTPNSPVCNGTSVGLTSSGSALNNLSWTGPNGYNSTSANPSLGTVSPSNSGNYTATGTALSGVNLLTNGGFEDGNTGFGTSYNFHANNLTNFDQCSYTVGPNPSAKNNGFCVQSGGHTGSNQMIVDGATLVTGGAGVVAWSQSISVAPGANYQFSYWVQSIISTSPAILQLYVNGVPVGTPNNAPSTSCSWVEFIVLTNSGSNSVLQLTLVDLNLESNGNDFAIDDLIFQQVFTATSTVNLTVNPILPVSVSVAASANSVTQGTAVTYTATPTNGGATPTYQWKVNGVNVGTNSTTFSYIPNQGDIITCVLTSSITCTSGNPATSNTVTMIVNPGLNFWRGTNSTDWGTPSNWTANFIPLAGDNVVYATVANYGSAALNDLFLDQNRTIGSLINATNKRLVVPAAKSLTVNDIITVTPPVENPIINPVDLIYIYANSALANGSLSFKNAQNSPVYGTVEFYSKSSWDLAKPINHKYNWQYFGIPVETVKASPTFDGAYVRQRDEAGIDTTTHWSQLTNNSDMIPFKGYEICYPSPRTTLIQGKLMNRDFNSGQLAKTLIFGGLNVLYPGQHILANPYTAAIDIRQITFGSDLQQTIYMYNTGTFAQWTQSVNGGQNLGNVAGQYTAVPKNLAGTSQIPLQIPSMSSFLVAVMNSTPNAYVSLTYNSVIMGNTDQNRVKSIDKKQFISTIIDVEGENGGDRMWLFADENCTRKFDNGYDAQKLIVPSIYPQIYAVEQDGNYQINTIDNFNNTTLAFQAGQDKDYTMRFTHENIDHLYQKITLYDVVAKTLTDVTANGSSYTFTAETTAKPINRFRLFVNKENNDATTSKINIFNLGKTLNVRYTGTSQAEIYIFDLTGRKIDQRKIQPNAIEDFELDNQKVYIVKIISNEKTETSKILIQ